MSDFIDVHGIAIRNRISVDGRVTPTVEDWNALLEYIDRQESENKALRQQLAEKEVMRLKELEGFQAYEAEITEMVRVASYEYKLFGAISGAFVSELNSILQKHKGN